MFRFLILAFCLATVPVLASLRDLASCDPLKKDAHCPPDPAFGGSTSFDFTKAGWNDELNSFWSVDAGTAKDNRHVSFNNTDGKGAGFSVWDAGQAPTLTSNKYLLFGKVSVEVQAARGQGLITAIVLKSDSGDEIDWELLGSFENQAQTNYFFDGQPLFNTYNTTYQLSPSPSASSFSSPHKYSIEWTPAYLTFSIDSTVRKTWHVGEIPASKWPQTPMQIKIGVWSVSNDSDPGEIAWAGGVPQWQGHKDGKDPYTAYVRLLELEDYVGGCNATTSGSTNLEYQYNDRTHGWQDIQVKGCSARTAPGANSPPVLPPNGGTQTTASTTSATNTSSETGRASSTGAEAPNQTGDDEGAAPLTKQLSSPLAAVVVLVSWLFIL